MKELNMAKKRKCCPDCGKLDCNCNWTGRVMSLAEADLAFVNHWLTPRGAGHKQTFAEWIKKRVELENACRKARGMETI